uniref:Dynein-1, subspecies f n=1 Tax=Marsilea vestita TaxID=59764 RepID=A0A126TKP8_MARVE|nr:axonemal inner arm dynein heavy chain 6 [Marsilea vestita]
MEANMEKPQAAPPQPQQPSQPSPSMLLQPTQPSPSILLQQSPQPFIMESELVESFESFESPEIIWFRRKMDLINMPLEAWTPEHALVAEEFLRTQNAGRLFAYLEKSDDEVNLRLSSTFPLQWKQVLVMVRDTTKPLNSENFHEFVQCEVVKGSPGECMLRLMQILYVPVMVDDGNTERNTTKDFVDELDKFMASLTESLSCTKGQTLLYVPPVKLGSEFVKKPRDKYLIQRLESIVIRWTRQIKEVIRGQDRIMDAEVAGALEEVEFWRQRSIDLAGIRTQISNPEITSILGFLEEMKSQYIHPFLNLSSRIDYEALVAAENLKFLTVLEEPCRELATTRLCDIPSVLPMLLQRIRMIWQISPFYNSSEKITGLLCKVSNEIIQRCSAEIPLLEIFEGDVEKCKTALEESIQACESWKGLYTVMMEKYVNPSLKKARGSANTKTTELGTRSIFAPLESFLQRCQDILEVCESQIQFSKNLELPVFGGTRGTEITKSLMEMQETFQKLVSVLKTLPYSLLDVKVTKWHDDYNQFKDGVKDLEVMMQNIMFMAFRHAASLSESIELMEAFKLMARRRPICMCVEQMGLQVLMTFSNELSVIKKQFDQLRRRPLMDYSYPRYAGAALWGLQFQRRLKAPMMLLMTAASYLLEIGDGYELSVQYNQIISSIDQFIKSQHTEWTNNIDPYAMKKLEKSLLDDSGNGLYLLKFDQSLLALFYEVRYWRRLGWEIPNVASDILEGQNELRVLRSNTLLVIRDCNKILSAVDSEEKGLVADRISHLTIAINPGLEKLTWVASPKDLERFLGDVHLKCHILEETVMQIRVAKKKIAQICDAISMSWLVSIDKKRIYDIGEFNAKQKEHRSYMEDQLRSHFNNIKQIITSAFQKCQGETSDVRTKWEDFKKKVEASIEASLRATVTKSLQELSNAVNTDTKTGSPMFSAITVLDKESSSVMLVPSIQELLEVVQTVTRELVTVISVVPRLRGSDIVQGSNGRSISVSPQGSLPSFFEVIAMDQEEVLMMITAGVLGVTEKVHLYLQYWEKKYKSVWDQDKDAYIRRYERAKKPLSAFDSDIVKYQDLQDDVQAEETITNVKFLRIDCGPLKNSIIGHCEGWANKFTTLLNSIARVELEDIYLYIDRNTKELKEPPESLDMLTEKVNNWHAVLDECATVKSRFEPLQEKYRVLEKFEVPISEDEKELLEGLPLEWEAFEQMLQSLEGELEQAKKGFYETLSLMIKSFSKEVTDARNAFVEKIPTTSSTKTSDALAFIDEETNKVEGFQQRAQTLWAGMSIFGMEKLSNKENTATLKDLELLRSMWTLKKEWEEAFDSWKDGLFSELDTSSMEASAGAFSKRVFKIGRDTKGWSVWTDLKDTIDAFKSTLPLTVDLRNPAMRQRHWQQLMEQVGQQFDPNSKDFTLAKVAELRLDLHAAAISELSIAASKELAIEEALNKIKEVWLTLELDMVPYREVPKIYKLRSTEDVFAILEEHRVTLSSMKSNRAHLFFAKDINKWEKDLARVSDTIEVVIQVQRQWTYLENIFGGSEDIRKQLPGETTLFYQVNDSFITSMNRLQEVRNARGALCIDGLMDLFTSMGQKLEKIQKSLDDYLEQKRQQFPRFYFLSNDDLLDILGQAKDPRNVQPHLKKCFEGIKRLELRVPGEDGHRQYEATGVFSPDGEYLPFANSVLLDTPPEEWLNRVEAAMYAAVKLHLVKALEDSKLAKKDKWVKDNAGQCVISAGQCKWTADCEKALSGVDTSKASLRKLFKKWISYLNKLTDMTRSRISKIDRNKVTALITIEVHARDVIDKLMRVGCSSPNDFEWASQLRFYWEKNDCAIKQVLSIFYYGYEYQGNNGRLVITPLTDRCYITLGAALFTRRGGNPLGPAGTGKTETVKDLGKALARYVIVFNCSDGVDYKMTATMFSGIAQTGAWICLDEFNRIEVEVLSVVATQIATIMSAIKAGFARFIFQGMEIRLIPTCGIFVTMNPGYAGRSELPENLKAMLRPVSMMVPDFTLIAENMLFSEGFRTAKILAKKLIAIMELSQRQLSKQDHYDYGLRSFVIPIARAAGATKRGDPDMVEEHILMGSMRDLIMPKLIYADIPLFNALLSDLFPGVELPQKESETLRKALEQELVAQGLQVVNDFVSKIIQMYDCMLARHGNMLVGKTGSGKTVAWKTLQRAQGRLKDQGSTDFEHTHVHIINPLALSNDEIYGTFNRLTNEWIDGVLSNITRKVCCDETTDKKWILFDGPVDTLWIESMNSLLDDNKILTLLNGERISMPSQVSLLFEVEDLSQASPATVSRAGMIYLNVEDLKWWPYAESWLQRKIAAGSDQVLIKTVRSLLEKYVDKVTEFQKKNCKELVPTDSLCCIITLCTLFDSLATPENGVAPFEGDSYIPMIENWFLFVLIWSIGAGLDEEGRTKFDILLREMDPRYPAAGIVYDYYLEPKKKTFVPWEEKLSGAYKIPVGAPFFKIQVPTVDTVRTSYILKTLILAKKHAMVVGRVGVGKTIIVQSIVNNLPDTLSSMTINFSAQTSSNSLQDAIEGRFEKRTKGIYAPAGGKRLVCFVDDINMPKKSQFGFMPPLELLKLWMDNGFWYDRQKQELKYLKNMQLVAAMAPPGGGRNNISQRVQACFSLINITTPSDNQMKRIFGAILTAKLANFEDEPRLMGDALVAACVDVYNAVTNELLPIPGKGHYVFNMRDLAKVIQGLLQATREHYISKDMMLQLLCHECFRVYADRMWDVNDKLWLQELLDQKLKDMFNTEWKTLFKDGELSIFTSCMQPGADGVYEPIPSFKELREVLEENLRELSTQPGCFNMDLVLFRDAMEHVCRIHRVLVQPRGNLLLVGVGGSGRKSLTRLAAFIADMKVFTINVTKNYGSSQFHDDLKALYQQAGVGENRLPVVFLFDDTQIVVETFLEDINNMLSTGEVPNLFTKDDLSAVFDQVRADAKKANAGETDDELYTFFLERARENLHIVLCLSPVQESFHRRLMMFPGLVNCSTIDWFLDWPEDALLEVAIKLMADESTLNVGDTKAKVCKLFVTIHKSVVDTSAKMLANLKRHNYVTPTSYLDFAKGYRKLLAEKKKQLEDSAAKLKGGLHTLNETREQVAKMQVVCQEKKEVVAVAKKECEEILVEIVQEKRVIDEQEKQVNEEAAKIEKEAKACNAIAFDCQQDLDKALPALQAAEEALNVLTKKDLSEVKAYAKPPALVEMTLEAVMTVLKKPPTWDEAKKFLSDASFLGNLMKYDKELLVDAVLKKIGKYTSDPDFTPESVGKVSGAARGLCLWVRAMESYGYVNKEVAPKKAKLKAAQDTLHKKEAALQDARNKLEEVRKKVQALKDKYDRSLASKEALQRELDDLELKLERAEKLISGLAGEKSRWETSITTFQEEIKKLPGDCLMAAAFLSYAGPFASEYRDDLVKGIWVPEVLKTEIPSTTNFGFSTFLADAGDVRDWNLQGLPADSFSTENGVLVTRTNRWPLMIDPQEQAKKWVKNMEASNGLVVVDLQTEGLMRTMEDCIQLGKPVLLVDILQEIDPSLEPILAKALISKGSRIYIKLGEKEIEYNPKFRLYITTKLANPHFSPEISVKTTIINFAVKDLSLQAQLLTLVVQKERPDLDKQRNELIVQITLGKKTQASCEDQILRLLATAEGPLLDNLDLIQTLDISKQTFETVKQSLEVAEVTAKSIEVASAAYKPCAERASLLYFILNDLVLIDSMYQFSLEAYMDLFLISITRSTKSEVLTERIKSLIDYHTYAVYRYTSRALFEKHKLLLSLMICAKILLASNVITDAEWQFFLRGGTVLDKSKQAPNPAPEWITESAWDDITELATNLPTQFDGIVTSLQQETLRWEQWFKTSEPENVDLPGDWEDKLNELQHLIILRCFRQDRLMFATARYVANVLGQKFVEPPMLDLGESFGDSSPISPLLFILSAGVDPTTSLQQFAVTKGVADNFHAVALGQGQGPIAMKLIHESAKTGGWVFLANCHLMTKWLPQLEKVIQGLEKSNPHEMFRLWLSSAPNNNFPISILQRSVKMTAEPPKGLRANVLRLYTGTTEESFQRCRAQTKYQKLFFALAYFHSVLLERRKFGTLGLNIPYDFNDTDFQVSDDLLKTYLDAYEITPFEALKYLISEANYGGRVTDEIDRRVLSSYLTQFYCEEALSIPNFTLSTISIYHIPDDGTLQTHKEFIQTWPTLDRPEAFGQHTNADIASQLASSRLMLTTSASLQKNSGGSKGGVRQEDIVMNIAGDLLLQVPEPFDLVDVQHQKAGDPSALHTVLFQEIERYNILLRQIRESCANLQKGIQGLVVMSSDLETMYKAFSETKVPAKWIKSYPTLKPLGAWTRDLVQRIVELKAWADGNYPIVYWLAGFTYPADFLTAVMQMTARRNLVPIDTLTWEFSIINKEEKDINEPPKEGIYVKGLYLEGAGWDRENECLKEPQPMELIVQMPILHFKPVVSKKKPVKGIYMCPLYLYPIRTGSRERPSFLMYVTLKCGEKNPDHWVKRGTALLLALAT